jgi:hypothetical protein
MAEEVLTLPNEEDEAEQYLRMQESIAQYKTGNPDAILVTDGLNYDPVIGAKKAPAVTGAPAATPETASTIAPTVIGNKVIGVNDVYIKPAQEAVALQAQAADPGNPFEVTAQDAEKISHAVNNPRYPDPNIQDSELAVTALAKEEQEAVKNIPVNPVIEKETPAYITDKIARDLKTVRQEIMDGFAGNPNRNRNIPTGEFAQEDVISEADRIALNGSINKAEFFNMPWNQFANSIEQFHNEANTAEDYEEAARLQVYYDQRKNNRILLRNHWNEYINSDKPPKDNYFSNPEIGALLTEEHLILNPEIMEFLADYTGGPYDEYGNLRNPYQIIRDYKGKMRFKTGGVGQTLFEMVRTSFADDEDRAKENYARAIWDRTTPDDFSDAAMDYAGAALADPFTYLTFGIPKIAETLLSPIFKWGGNKIIQNRTLDAINRLRTSKVTQGTASGAATGAAYTGMFDYADQQVRINVDLQKEVDWGKFAQSLGFGGAIGGPLGFLVSGYHAGFNNLANRYITFEGSRGSPLVAQDVFNMFKNSIDNERDLYVFLGRMGWDRKEALAQLEKLKGFTYDSKARVWKTKEGETWIPPKDPKFRDEAYDSSRNYDTLTKDAAGGDDYVHITASQATTPRGRTAVGQRIFDTIDQKVGRWATDLVYGGDSKLIHLNMREELDNFRAARDEAEINATRVNNKLKDLRAANPEELADESIYRLIRDPKLSRTPAQEAYIKEFLKEKNHMLTRAYKSGVLSKEQYQNFIKDVTYLPRVWNLQYLTTDEGASMLSQFLREVWSIDKNAARSVVRNLTGENYVDELTASQFAPTKLKNAIVFRADEDLSVLNSTHLDFNRKIKIPREIEPALDMFMAKLDDRMLSFFDDTFNRTSMASRFGPKHERVAARADALRKAGDSRAAKAWEDYFYTNTNDLRSPVIQAARDNAKFADIVRRVNAYQTVSKLGAAQILNATQVFVNGATMLSKQGGTTLLTAPFRAVQSISRALFKNKKDFQLAKEAATTAEMDMQRVVTENAIHGRIIDKQFNSKILSFLNEPTKFLRGVGYMKVEEANRVAATALGNWQLRKWHSDLQRLVSTGKGQSTQALKLYKDLKGFGVKNPLAEEIPVRDLQYATYKFNREINFAGETINLPQHWKTPLGKLLTKFKSFSFYQARFLKRHVLDEAFLHGNINPLIMYLSAAGVAGGGVGAIRDTISLKDVKQDREAIEALVYGISRAGGFGLFVDTLRDVGERGSGLVDTIAGPTLGDIERGYVSLTSGQIDKIFDMLSPAPIPNISNIKF